MRHDYKIKSNLSKDEKAHLLNILNNSGCKNIYLHHSIFINSEKFSFILPENYMDNNIPFISAYNKSNGELHFFSSTIDGVSLFQNVLLATNNLKDIGKGIQYLGIDAESSKWLFKNNVSLLSKLIEMNEYYVYTLNKDKFQYNCNLLEAKIIKDNNTKFCFATNKKDIIRLLNLQKGYLYEEMQYPNQILSEKFIYLNLQKIIKLYRLFFLEKNNYIVAKCEWNAFSDKIFQIGGVFVEPSFRNENFAYTMLFKMLNHSFSNLQMDEASLFVRMSNLKAQKLYEKLLFERYKTNLVWAIFKIN